MKFNNYNRAVLQSALKRSNQRLVQLGKSLDPQFQSRRLSNSQETVDSAIYKRAIAPFSNETYGKYLGKSKSGYDKFDIRLILKDIESGKLDPSEANDFLVKAAGVRLSPDGDITPTSEGGIETISEVKEEAIKTVQEYKDTKELLEKFDDIIDMRDNFNVDYDAYSKEFGPEKIESDPIVSKLFDGGLVYDELKLIHDEMKSQLDKQRNKAITYGGN